MINRFLPFFAILYCTSLFSQVSFSGKAHLLFPTTAANWQSISESAELAYEKQGKNSIGFNAGLSVKIDITKSFFLMPELFYTTFKNELTDPITNTTLKAVSNRVDVPVLVGYNVFDDNVGVFAGPVGSYNLKSENQYNDFLENASSQFTVGYQVGAQVKISKILVSARYEGPFSKDQRTFINKNTNQIIRYDDRPNIFMAGVGYVF